VRSIFRRSDKKRIAEHFHVHGPAHPEFGESYNVAPQTFQPVIRLNRDSGEREIVLMLLANSGGAAEVTGNRTLQAVRGITS
jgi:hypothetical protein